MRRLFLREVIFVFLPFFAFALLGDDLVGLLLNAAPSGARASAALTSAFVYSWYLLCCNAGWTDAANTSRMTHAFQRRLGRGKVTKVP